MCFGDAQGLSEFEKEVSSYGFKDTPRYEVLRKMLAQLSNEK